MARKLSPLAQAVRKATEALGGEARTADVRRWIAKRYRKLEPTPKAVASHLFRLRHRGGTTPRRSSEPTDFHIKRIDMETLSELLGPSVVERLEVAILRRKAMRITSVTTEEVQTARTAIESSDPLTKGQRSVLSKLLLKWATESASAKTSFTKYLDKLGC